MQVVTLAQKLFFRLRLFNGIGPLLRKWWWQAQGAQFGPGTSVPRLLMIWPHQVRIGAGCTLEDDLFFKFAGPWRPGPTTIIKDRVFIGRGCEFNIGCGLLISDDCLIASGCKFIDADHGMTDETLPMHKQPRHEAAIVLEEDVWLGVNVVVLKGVTIGKGAVVGAGAVVTKSIAPHEIWAGVPARKIGARRAPALV